MYAVVTDDHFETVGYPLLHHTLSVPQTPPSQAKQRTQRPVPSASRIPNSKGLTPKSRVQPTTPLRNAHSLRATATSDPTGPNLAPEEQTIARLLCSLFLPPSNAP
jgi:hypothetical protein